MMNCDVVCKFDVFDLLTSGKSTRCHLLECVSSTALIDENTCMFIKCLLSELVSIYELNNASVINDDDAERMCIQLAQICKTSASNASLMRINLLTAACLYVDACDIEECLALYRLLANKLSINVAVDTAMTDYNIKICIPLKAIIYARDARLCVKLFGQC